MFCGIYRRQETPKSWNRIIGLNNIVGIEPFNRTEKKIENGDDESITRMKSLFRIVKSYSSSNSLPTRSVTICSPTIKKEVCFYIRSIKFDKEALSWVQFFHFGITSSYLLVTCLEVFFNLYAAFYFNLFRFYPFVFLIKCYKISFSI